MSTEDWRQTRPGGLAEQLRWLRKEVARLTGPQLAARLGWTTSTGPAKISKIENRTQLPTEDEVRAWCEQCGHPEFAGELVDLVRADQAEHREWRHRLRGGQAGVQDDYDQRARAATVIRNAAPLVIPSFFQTPGYARGIMTGVAAMFGTTDVEAAVSARMRRQAILSDPGKTFQFVTTEAALRLQPCPAGVMQGQLFHLIGVIRGQANAKLGIIPFKTELAVMPYTDVLLLDDLAIVEHAAGEDLLGAEESKTYAAIFDALMAEAVTGEDAESLIFEAISGLRADGDRPPPAAAE